VKMSLKGKVCLVTGASRGIGKGIAVQLGEAGAIVYITGRSSSTATATVGGTLSETAEEINTRGGQGIPVVCDHTKDDQVKAVFDQIKKEQGKLDVLVNNAYAAVNAIFKESAMKHKFYQYDGPPGEFWDTVNNVGLRNHYICSVYATQMMVEKKSGLIVNVSSFGGAKYLFNVAYGVGKCAVDRMTSDMAVELKGSGVSCITLYPGPVLTEMINDMKEKNPEMQTMFAQSETPEFSGKAVASLAADPQVDSKSGSVCLSAELALEYRFKDINGTQPPSFREHMKSSPPSS